MRLIDYDCFNHCRFAMAAYTQSFIRPEGHFGGFSGDACDRTLYLLRPCRRPMKSCENEQTLATAGPSKGAILWTPIQRLRLGGFFRSDLLFLCRNSLRLCF